MKNTLTLIILILLTKTIAAQQIDSLVFQNISNQLVDRYLADYATDDEIERRGDCIYGKKHGFTLSCILTDYSLDWTTDFDGDLIDDIVIQVVDEGLGGGGNAFGYEFYAVTLDQEKEIKDIYTLFGGGKMSYALLSVDSVNRGTIYATYEQNPYAYGFDEVTYENKEQLALEFTIKDGMLQEKNYASCLISEMNKDIFKNDIDFKVERSVSLDDLFNIQQEEILYLQDQTHYYASITGCDEINLFITHTIPYQKALEKDRAKMKNIWLEQIRFLKENTRYKTVLDELDKKLTNLESKDLQLQEYGGATQEFVLQNDWKAFLFVSGNEEQGSFVTVRLVKSKETEMLEFWELLKRKCGL